MLKITGNFPRIVDPAPFVTPIKQGQTAIAQRFYQATQHSFKRTAGDDIFSLAILNKTSRPFGILRDHTGIGDEQRRLSIHINFQLTGKKLLPLLTDQTMMPDGGTAIKFLVPINAYKVIWVHARSSPVAFKL